MSEDLYPTRLFWSQGRGGIAKLNGRRISLRAVPQLPGVPLSLVAIDYAPGVVAMLMPCGEKMRDMTSAECAAADTFLAAATAD